MTCIGFYVFVLNTETMCLNCVKVMWLSFLWRKLCVWMVLCFRVSAKTLSNEESEHASFPPRGWNSYDSFSWIISEEEFLQNALIISERLHAYGYEVWRLKMSIIDFHSNWFSSIRVNKFTHFLSLQCSMLSWTFFGFGERSKVLTLTLKDLM